MNNLQTKREIYNCLRSLPDVRESGQQLIMRCFLCGDSKKNKNKKRLGIKFDLSNPDEPILYHCFNCNRSGVFSNSMLKQLDINYRELDVALRSMNNSLLKDDGKKVNKYKVTKEIKVELPPLYKTDNNIQKLRYLYNRIGYRIPIEDFENLKLVLNLQDFLRTNNIKPTNNYVQTLSNDYVGFLSKNNEYMICRDITNTHRMRYVKYNIFNVYDNINSFYSIKGSLDLLSEDDIHISIAEGPFDILSLQYNVFNGGLPNNICIAACNSSFIDPIKYYMKKGVVGSNVKIDCYQDNDDKTDFKRLKKETVPYILKPENFSVYYNQLSKDFGVPKESILIDKLKI